MAAPLFSVNAHRYDPYRTFKFQILWDGQVVAGLRKCSGLKRTVEAVKWRSAGEPNIERVMPGGATYEPITLEQGLTHDPVFEEWANLVHNVQGSAAMSLKNFRKDIVLNILNLQGTVALSYRIYRCWPSEAQLVPELDAGTRNSVGIQTLKLENEGWERDTSVAEPSET
ncbi:MAG: phage tail protein [Roseobacter sp.]